MSFLKTDLIKDSINSEGLLLSKIDDGDARYLRKSYVQYDTGGYSASTSWVLGPVFSDVSGFAPGSLIKLTYHVPARNDSTGYGGLYIEPQVRFDETNWYSLGSSGYSTVMENGGSSINYYRNVILLDPEQSEEFSFGVQLYLLTHQGTATIHTSMNVNSVSGTATALPGDNYYQHYAHVLVEEYAKMEV